MSLEWNCIHQGDNLGHLQKMKDEGLKFNLILTDPPYNIGKDFGNDTDSQTLEVFLEHLDRRIKLMSELLSEDGAVILFCTHLYVGDVQLLLRNYMHQRRLMIWFYENGMSRQIKEPVTEYEPFWWFSKSESFVYNVDDVRVPYKSERVKNPVYKVDAQGNKRAWTPDPRGRKRGDVWAYPTLAGKRFEDEKTPHPTQKPESLMIDLIRAFCPKNMSGKLEGRILDPYMGSGTVAACCERLNKDYGHLIRWMGCELEQKWVDVGTERVMHERGRVIERDIFE